MWIVIPGVALIFWGIAVKQSPISSSALPPAKIEDGRTFQLPAYERSARRGTGRIVLGTLLLVGGVLLGILIEDLRSAFSGG